MNSKTLIQIILGVLILIISGLFYNYYFSQKKIETSKKEKINTDKIKKTDSSGNIIKDIIYESRDEKGNIYTIKSEYGEFNDAVSDTILMTKVSAIIKFNDGSSMTMRSENAKYDIVSYDTNFFNNVEMDYLDHKVSADNINIYFKDSKLEAFNNLVYRNLDLSLIADKIEINLIEKSSKIFMFDNEKIKVIKK